LDPMKVSVSDLVTDPEIFFLSRKKEIRRTNVRVILAKENSSKVLNPCKNTQPFYRVT